MIKEVLHVQKTAFFLAIPLLSVIKHKLLIGVVIYWLIRTVFSFSCNPEPCTGAEAGHTWFEEMLFLLKELSRKSHIISKHFLLPYQLALLTTAPIWLLSSNHLFVMTAGICVQKALKSSGVIAVMPKIIWPTCPAINAFCGGKWAGGSCSKYKSSLMAKNH